MCFIFMKHLIRKGIVSGERAWLGRSTQSGTLEKPIQSIL